MITTVLQTLLQQLERTILCEHTTNNSDVSPLMHFLSTLTWNSEHSVWSSTGQFCPILSQVVYLLCIITIEDVISLNNCDKIDCIDTVKMYTKCYLQDNSQHVFAEVQSQHEYTAGCAFNHYTKSKVIWIKCDQVICYVDHSIRLTNIKQWMQTIITHGWELLLTWLVIWKTLFLTSHLLKLFENNLFWMTNSDSFTVSESNQLHNDHAQIIKWASSSAVRKKCLRVIHDSDDPAHSVSKSFAQLLSLL